MIEIRYVCALVQNNPCASAHVTGNTSHMHVRVLRRIIKIITMKLHKSVFAIVTEPMVRLRMFTTSESINLAHTPDSIESAQQDWSTYTETHYCKFTKPRTHVQCAGSYNDTRIRACAMLDGCGSANCMCIDMHY